MKVKKEALQEVVEHKFTSFNTLYIYATNSYNIAA